MSTSLIVRTLRKKLSSYVNPPNDFNQCNLYGFDTNNIYVNLNKFDEGIHLDCDLNGENIEIQDIKDYPCGHVYEILVTELNDLYLRNEIFGATALWPFAISLANKEIIVRHKDRNNLDSCVYLFQNDINLIRSSATTLYGKTLQTTGQYEGVEVTPYQGIILQDLRSGDLDSVRQLAAISPTDYTIFRRFIEIMRNDTDVDTQYNALREIACLKRNGLGVYSYQTTSGYYTTPEYTSTTTPEQNTGSVQLAYQPFNSSTYTYSTSWTTINALRNIDRLSEIDYSTGMFKFDGNIYKLVYMVRVGDKMIPYIPIWYNGFDVETYLAHTLELPSTLTAESYKAFMTEETNRTLNATKAIKFVCEFAIGSGNYPEGAPITTTIDGRLYNLYRLDSWCGEEIKRFVELVNHMNMIEAQIAEYLQTNLDTIKQLFPQREGESESDWIPRITGHRLDSSGNWIITSPITTYTPSLYNASNDTIYNGDIAENQTQERYYHWIGVKSSNLNYYHMVSKSHAGDYALMLYRWRYTTFNVPWYVNKASSQEAYLINERTDDTSYELDSNALALNFDQVYLYYDGLKEIFHEKIICLPMVQVKQVIDACYQTSSNMTKRVLCFLRDDIAYLKRVYSEWFDNTIDGATCIKSEFNTNYFRKWQTILAINFAYADYTAGKTSADTMVPDTEFYALYAKCQDTSEVNYRNICNYYLFYLDDWEWHTRADNLGHAVSLYLKPASSTSTYPEMTETVEIGLDDSYVVNSDGTITMNETTYEKLIVFTNVSNTFLSEDTRRTIIPMLDMDWKNGSSNPPLVDSFNVPEELTADSWANEMHKITKAMLGYASNGFLREISEYCSTENPGGWQCQGYETFRSDQIIEYVSCCIRFAQNIKYILDFFEENKETFKEIIPPVKDEPEDSYDARVTLDYSRLKINGVRIDTILLDACDGIYMVEDEQATFYKNAETVEERTALWESIAEALQVFADTAVLNDPRTPEGLISNMKEYTPEENAGGSILYTASPLSIRICKAWYWDPYEYSGYISPDVITYKITNN